MGLKHWPPNSIAAVLQEPVEMGPFRLSRRSLVATFVASSLLLGAPLGSRSPGAEVGPAPSELVRGVTERILMLAEAGLPAERREQEMDRLLADAVDVERLAKAVLGRHWRAADAGQRQRFTHLLVPYLRATYGSRIGEAAGYRMELGQPRPVSAGDVVVPGQARRGDGASIAVDWRLTREPEGWRILDVVVEGVSLALAWRNEFDAVIGRAGLNGLLEEMARRVEPRLAAL
jgi:phospholipid transport system substrate-binding protein